MRPIQRARRGREALRLLEGVGRRSWWDGSDLKALSVGWDVSVDLPSGQGRVVRPFCRGRRVQEAFPEGWVSRPTPAGRGKQALREGQGGGTPCRRAGG